GCAKEPGRRYQTAGELADDLGRWLAGEPIRARPVGQAERLWRWGRRNRALATLTSSVALLLVLLALVSTGAALWLRAALKQTEEAKSEATQKLAESHLSEARAWRWSGRSGRRFNSLEALDKAARIFRSLGEADDRVLELRNEAIASLSLVDVRLGDQQWD